MPDHLDPARLEDPAATLRSGSSSFAAAARLLDPPTRDSVRRLYAWCRYCDDVVDNQTLGHGGSFSTPQEVADRVDWLRSKTLAALAGGDVRNPAFAGLQDVAARHRLDHRYPLALIDGFAMDAQGQFYDTLDDTILYAYHVAGVVGIMMAFVLGVSETAMLRRACDLGIAFQLSNIARDVIEDAAVGRIYLPDAWLRAESIERADLAAPTNRVAVARVAGRLVEAAEPYYASARVGIAGLPIQASLAIAAARSVYRDIGHLVQARGASAWDTRTVVGRPRRLTRIAEGCALVLRQRLTAPFRSDRPRDGLWTPATLR